MDLTTYYEEFQSTYNISIFALCLAGVAVVFIGIRSLRDSQESVRKKIANLALLFLIFCLVLTYFLLGPNLAKKDIQQKTIYCYEGVFEIVEVSHGIYTKGVFLFEGEKKILKYSEDMAEDDISPGKYEGQLIYAQHLAQVLDLEIHENM